MKVGLDNGDTGKVSGFLVVRSPRFNRQPLSKNIYRSVPPCVGEICYGGVDRMPWFEVDELHYEGELPLEIEAKRDQLEQERFGYLSLSLSQDLRLAIDILNFSNSVNSENELIAVRSAKLAEI